MSPARKRKDAEAAELSPDLLPESLRKVGPHAPLKEYFTDSPPPDLFDQWADFYEKQSKKAVSELINILAFIAGSSSEVTASQIKKSEFSEVSNAVAAELQESATESPITLFLKGAEPKAFSFWTDLCNSLIVCKGLFKDAFDVFKDWVFAFCDSPVRPLRATAVVAVLAIEEFLAESISRAVEELDRLESAKQQTAVSKRQVSVFRSELESSRALSMQLFTTVIRNRFRDVDPRIRSLCVQTMAKAGMASPADFGDANILKHIGVALHDDSPKIRREALKQIRTLLAKETFDDAYRPFLKSLAKDLPDLCHDVDNGIVVATFDLMAKLSKRGLLKTDALEPVFRLCADDAANVRSAAAKFFAAFIFNGRVKKAVKGNVQGLHEAQLREFVTLAKQFTPAELDLAIEAFAKPLECLKNWELMSQMILSDGKDTPETAELAQLLGLSVVKTQKSGHAELTRTMLQHMSKLLNIFKKNTAALSGLLDIPACFDVKAIDSASGERQVKLLVQEFHKLFSENPEPDVYLKALSCLQSWSKGGNEKLNTAAADELKAIADEFKPFKKMNAAKLQKLEAVCVWHDFSGQQKLRDFLKETADSDDQQLASAACRALEQFVMWDVRRIQASDDEVYDDEFESMQALIGRRLHDKSLVIRQAAFQTFSTLIALSGLVRCQTFVDQCLVHHFFQTFHALPDKQLMFSPLTRPLTTHAVDDKFAVHAFWYLQDPALKQQVNDFVRDIKPILPVEGFELGDLIRTLEFVPARLKLAMRQIAKLVKPRGTIDAWLDAPDDSLIPYYAPVLERLTPDEAELLQPRAEGQTAKILAKRSYGQKLVAKDFAIKGIKQGRKAKEDSKPGEGEEDEIEEGGDDESVESGSE